MGQATRARSYFDGIAGSYHADRYGPGADPWRAYFFGGRLRLAAEMLGPSPGATVLDLGAGSGALAEAIGDRARVIRLDLSPAMLAGAPGDAVAADATRIPLRSGSVDTVVALGLTTYLDDLAPLLAEVRRVLAPGGRLLLSTTRRAAPDTVLRATWRATVGRLGVGRGVLQAGLGIRAWSDRETDRALRRAGFAVRARREHNFTVFPLAYLAKSASIRLGRRLESAPGRARGLASDALVLAEKLPPPPSPGRRRIRVLRVIARLNVGGPARQALLLSARLDPRRFRSTLVTGRVSRDEGDMTHLARTGGYRLRVLDGLGRAISPLDDLRAFLGVLAAIRRERPDVVHTHTAKAGALGRVAACLAGVPVRIHTFHGHVLHGYFGPAGSALARVAEGLLARLSTRIVAVSPEVRDDLARRHRAIPAAKIDVVPLGLDLTDLLACEARRGELRAELGLPADAPIVATVGRVTAVKEPRVLVETARLVHERRPDAVFLVAGGGDLLEATRLDAARAGLGDAMRFLGWRSDLDRILADADLALLTSRNEGTPVALIEAAAAGVPAVATRVGGVPSVVRHGETGLLAGSGDPDGLAEAVLALAGDPARRRAMGAAAREHVRERFAAERLIADLERLYLLCCRRSRRHEP